ncbi:MAG: DsbA family protein [Phycisphaeraceae bacterium]|nr:DsbA family protein [Phycisphaeraceae bacterium]
MPIPTPQPASPADSPGLKSGGSPSALVPMLVGAGVLAAAVAASGSLVLDHLGVFRPPGCGAGSPCRAATSSVWGSIPGVNWPVSFVGFAYFLTVLVAWVRSGGRWSPGLRWLARAGALGSLFFLGVMLVAKLPCKYCLASHIANLCFVGVAEWTNRRPANRPFGRGLAVAAGVFAAATVALGFAEQQAQKKPEAELAASTRAMIEASKPKTPAPETGELSQTAAQSAAKPPAAQPARPIVLPTVFTGRHRFGPEIAPIRIVMWTGYQCPDCRKMEPQVKEIMTKRKDVSISIKHFPFCPDCNPHVVRNDHPNGCWAARAAEAAGILKGTDGFWKMHEWLFSRGGAFTDKDLLGVLMQFGWDSASFIQTMQGPTTLRNVQTDIEEAVSYGLRFSPMIFINGIELKGWNAPGALTRAVETLAAANPEPQGPEADRPVKAAEKSIADWREQPAMAWPTRPNLPALGPANAKVKITIFGDLLEPTTAEADRTVRDAMAGRTDMWYEFRYFPVDKECNPALPQTLFPGSCRAARAAEAANTMGGSEAYWRMHDWIQANPKNITDETLRGAAKAMGLDPDELFRRMESPDIRKLVETDANIGSRLHITEIPRISVNGKHIARWRLKDEYILERIIEEAASEEPPHR